MAAVEEAGEPVAGREVEQPLGPAHDVHREQGGNAEQDEPSGEVHRAIGSGQRHVLGIVQVVVGGGPGPEGGVLGDREGTDHDADPGVVAKAARHEGQEEHLEGDVGVERQHRRPNHEEGPERKAHEGDVERAGGEAEPGTPAPPPEGHEDRDRGDATQQCHGKPGDVHRVVGLVDQAPGGGQEQEAHGYQAHPRHHVLTLDTGSGECGVRPRPDAWFGGVVSVAGAGAGGGQEAPWLYSVYVLVRSRRSGR